MFPRSRLGGILLAVCLLLSAAIGSSGLAARPAAASDPLRPVVSSDGLLRGTQAPLAAPTIRAVAPTEGYNYTWTEITVTGSGFRRGARAWLGTVALSSVTVVDGSHLTARVPSNLPAGPYTLTVISRGQTASQTNAFTVLSRGDGALGDWQPISLMNSERTEHAAVVANGYLYVLGGYLTNAVERARLNRDGSLGRWEAAAPMTTPRVGLEAVVARGYLYAIGGYNREGGQANLLKSVERARFNADGTLGPWEPVAAMLETRRAFAAVTVSNWLYAIGSGSQWDVERAYIKPDGTLGAWEPDASMSMRRWNLAAVPVGRFIYAIGSGDMHPYPQVERTYVNQDGRLAPWEAVAPMTTGRRYLSAVYAHGYLYAIGSESSDGGGSTVERAAVRPDGSLSPWQLTGYLPDTRSRGAAVIARDHIYLTAGWTRVVERAQLNRVGLRAPTPAAAWPDRPTTITLHGSNFLPGAQARLGRATSLSVSFVTTTTLSATVPAGLEPGWYALTIINADGRRTSADNAVLVNGPLRVDTATPPGGTDAERTEVTITGENFAPPLDVRLGDWPLEDVTFVSSSMLTATVPLGLPAGSYDLTVRHRHAQSSTRPAAFVVAPTGTTPTLGPWEVAPKLNVGGLTRYAFTVPGFVVAVHAFNPNNGVERARIAPDGSISAWERLPSGSQLRLGACAPGITRREDSLYLVGGARCDNMWTELAYVERVRIKPDGSLGTWQALAPLPSPRYGAAALATKDFLYVLGGSGSSRTRSTVERAPILLDGTLGAWEPQSSLLTARARHAVVQVDGYLYVLGGYNSRDWAIGNSVERAAINPDGTLGPWQRVSSMVSLHLDHSALAVGGYLYVLGGDHSIVERAAIKPDGTLGAWQVVSTVDGRRTIPGVVHIGRYLYAIGGDTVGSVTRAPISGLVPPYPIYIPPGTYEVNRCGEADLIVSGRNAGRLTECVPSVEVRADGYMQFNFTWYVDLADDVPSVIKKSDAGNRKMYITDNQGNRYDHVALGGAAAEERRMYDRSTVSGWFLFLPAKRDATTFTFHDDDNRLLINDIVLSP